MNIALWIATGLLAVGYLAGGLGMLLLPKDRFRNISEGQHYADEFSAGMIKAIGVMKLFAVAGLLLPPMVGVAHGLVPLAALGLVLLMTGAATVRITRKEWRYLLGDLGFFAVAAFVAWGRFFVEPLG